MNLFDIFEQVHTYLDEIEALLDTLGDSQLPDEIAQQISNIKTSVEETKGNVRSAEAEAARYSGF